MSKETSNDKENIEYPDEKQREKKQEEISLNEMKEKVKNMEEKTEDLNSQLLRLQADFVNYRNRMNKEKENSISYGIEQIACELLPVIDNFNRALEAEADTENSFFQGVKMIQDQITDVLAKSAVVEMEALGKVFDPNFHHAVVMEESDEYDSNVVIDVLQKGYMFKDKVLRPAMVKVSK